MLEDNVQGFQHLGLPVTHIDRSEVFYQQLGFQTVMRTELPTATGLVHVVMMQLKGFILELYQLAGSERAEVATRVDGHIDHFALDVHDIDRAFADIRARGLPVLDDAPIFLPFWEKGIRYFTVRGPDGEKVEFNQIIK